MFVCANILFVYFSSVTLTLREDIDPNLYSKSQKTHQITINLKDIYEDDLFDSYKKETPYIQSTIETRPLPQPPRPQALRPPEAQKPVFLDPLNVTLRGIIVTSQNESLNTAIISDNKTDVEGLYKVGDKIQDSQLIRIFNNKIVLLRSNGQQEVLYMRDQEAQSDPRFAQIQNWHTAITMKNPVEYTIYPEAFLKRVENLSHFIELLNLTTAYEKGVPIGTHVGTIEPQTLGSYLGLRTGDMIMAINKKPVSTTDDRLVVYKQITQSSLPLTVTVDLLRGKKPISLAYTVEQLKIELIKSQPLNMNGKIKQAQSPTVPTIQSEQLDPNKGISTFDKDLLNQESFDQDMVFDDEIAFLNKIKERDAFLMVQNNLISDTQHNPFSDQKQDFV